MSGLSSMQCTSCLAQPSHMPTLFSAVRSAEVSESTCRCRACTTPSLGMGPSPPRALPPSLRGEEPSPTGASNIGRETASNRRETVRTFRLGVLPRVAIIGMDISQTFSREAMRSSRLLRRTRASRGPPVAAGSRFGGYAVGEHLGRGGYGEVFSAQHASSGRAVAIKLQRADRKAKLAAESQVLRCVSHAPGFPRLLWFGVAHGHQAIVMNKLGPSLKDRQESGGNLSARAVRVVSQQVMRRLEALHERHWLHLDVKPANILFPPIEDKTAEEEPLLHLIDFGLSRKWWDELRGVHLSSIPRRGCVGTVRFSSIANQRSAALGRRDDIESLIYTIIFLRCGKLPWCHVQAPTKKERFRMMLEIKTQLSVDEICKDVPALAPVLHSVRSLEPEERPDYASLRAMLLKL